MNDKWMNERADEVRAAAARRVDLDRDLAATLARAESAPTTPTDTSPNRWMMSAAAATIAIAGIGALVLATRSGGETTVAPGESVEVTVPDVASTTIPSQVTTTIDEFTPAPTMVPGVTEPPEPDVSTTTSTPIAEIPEPTVPLVTEPSVIDPPVSAQPATTVPVSAPPTSLPPTTTVAPPAFPPEFTAPTQGGFTWAVALAGAELDAGQSVSDAPALVEAQNAAASVGYTPNTSDCDAGAREALGFSSDSSAITVTVYFNSEADAQNAAALFAQQGVDAVAVEVQTFCLD